MYENVIIMFQKHNNHRQKAAQSALDKLREIKIYAKYMNIQNVKEYFAP